MCTPLIILLLDQIVLETIIALFFGILGACLNTPSFKEISWSSEMRKQCVHCQLYCPYADFPPQVKLTKWILGLASQAMLTGGRIYPRPRYLERADSAPMWQTMSLL